VKGVVLKSRCFHEEELEVILALPEGDPRLAHAEECPACRALLLSYKKFMAPGGEAGVTERDDAARRLADFIAKEIAAPGSGAGGEKVVPFRRKLTTWFAGGKLRPALALAAVVALVVIVPLIGRGPGDAPITGVLRENGSAPALRGEVSVLSDGRVELTWDPVEEADAYRVVLYGADLEEAARFDVAGRSSLTVDPEGISPSGGSGTLLYRVLALRGGDEVARSELRVLLER
jgi:hypothetical protein